MGTKTVRDLIEKAHEQNQLRYAPERLPFSSAVMMLELRRTPMSGVEFNFDPKSDRITFACQSIDGVELEPHEFIAELAYVVGEEVTDLNDHPQVRPFLAKSSREPEEHRYIVTEVTSVSAASEEDAIARVVGMMREGDHEVMSQRAVPWVEDVSEEEELEQAQIDAVEEVLSLSLSLLKERLAIGYEDNYPAKYDQLVKQILNFPRADKL